MKHTVSGHGARLCREGLENGIVKNALSGDESSGNTQNAALCANGRPEADPSACGRARRCGAEASSRPHPFARAL